MALDVPAVMCPRPQSLPLEALPPPHLRADVGSRVVDTSGALATIDQAVESFSTPPLVVGLSLGGYTSLAYAAENPGKVAGVMLSGCSTEIKGKPHGLFRGVAARDARVFAPHGSWYVVDQLLAAVRG